MRFKLLGADRRNLTRSAAVLVIGALSAGCSSGVARFQDDFFTGSTDNQRQIIGKAGNQPYPGDTMQPVAGNMDYTGSVNRGAVQPVNVASAPVQRSSLAPVTTQPLPAPQTAAAPAAAPVQVAAAPMPSKPKLPAAPQPEPKPVSAKPASGTLGTLPADKLPPPSQPGRDNVAVLPQTPKVKEQETPQQAANAPATAKPKGAAGNTYTVVAGDTLFGIARKTGASAAAIKQANGLSDGVIRIGQVLTIPGAAAAETVKVASTAPAKVDAVTTGTAKPAPQPEAAPKVEPAAYTPPKKDENILKQASLDPEEDAPDSTGIGRMRWPVRGRVIAPYGAAGGKANDGIDIAVPAGTPVKAAENGVVIYAGDGLKEFGNTVLVRHEDGLVTVYGHASEIKVSRGDKVRRGQEIARSGMSGSAETPKLHFEVRKDSVPVDPKTFLE